MDTKTTANTDPFEGKSLQELLEYRSSMAADPNSVTRTQHLYDLDNRIIQLLTEIHDHIGSELMHTQALLSAVIYSLQSLEDQFPEELKKAWEEKVIPELKEKGFLEPNPDPVSG